MRFNLKSCVWEITLACCFSCKYCGSRGGKARIGELTTSECLTVADQLADLRCKRVSLIGGEVFIRKDWDIIAKRLTDKGISVSIITNGFMFDDEIVQRIKNAKLESIAISVDGPETIHDKYRQIGSYRRAILAMKRLTDASVPVSVITTLNQENVGYLEELYDVLCHYPISAWQLQACSPMGNAVQSGINYRFDPIKVIHFVRKYRDSSPFPMGIADNIGYYTDDDNRLRGNKYGGSPFSGCRAGLTAIGIDSIGNVRGCESMYDDRFIEGNLRNKTLKEIWENPNRFSYNRDFNRTLLTGKCMTCDCGPYCAGGCRSYNYFVHGKLYEAPICAKADRLEDEKDGK